MKLKVLIGATIASALAASAYAQTEAAPNYLTPLSRLAPAQGVVLIDPETGNPYAASGGGSGGGDATAANQTAIQGSFGGVTANRIVILDSDGNPVSWADPVPLQGGDGSTVASVSNPNFNTLIPSADAGAGITPVSSTAAESCHVMKASAGNLFSVSGYIGAAGFIMVFDSPTPPADGAVTPKYWAYSASAGSWSMNFGAVPARMLTGITVCASSTGPLTKTAYSTNTVFSGSVK